jgi:hypothetical protein
MSGFQLHWFPSVRRDLDLFDTYKLSSTAHYLYSRALNEWNKSLRVIPAGDNLIPPIEQRLGVYASVSIHSFLCPSGRFGSIEYFRRAQ